MGEKLFPKKNFFPKKIFPKKIFPTKFSQKICSRKNISRKKISPKKISRKNSFRKKFSKKNLKRWGPKGPIICSRRLQPSAGARKKPPVGGLNFLVFIIFGMVAIMDLMMKWTK